MKYTEEDIIFLREYYPKGDFDTIFERFPYLRKQNIISLCHKYGISADYYNKKKWTESELEIVKDYYYDKSLDELREMMDNRHTNDAIQTKAKKKFGYSKDRAWTSEELDILYDYYPIELIDDVCKRLPNRTRQAIVRKANNLKIQNVFYLDTYWSDEDEAFLVENWETMSDIELANALGRNRHAIVDKRGLLGLSRVKHYNEASYSNLRKYIRGNIGKWKSDSMKKCCYKCVLTGSKDFHVHHLYSLTTILDEVVNENNIVLKDNFSEYSQNELCFILEKFIDKQELYPLGVCVRKDIHSLFHSVYGHHVTPEMWERFVEDYNNGKYDIDNIA